MGKSCTEYSRNYACYERVKSQYFALLIEHVVEACEEPLLVAGSKSTFPQSCQPFALVNFI